MTVSLLFLKLIISPAMTHCYNCTLPLYALTLSMSVQSGDPISFTEGHWKSTKICSQNNYAPKGAWDAAYYGYYRLSICLNYLLVEDNWIIHGHIAFPPLLTHAHWQMFLKTTELCNSLVPEPALNINFHEFLLPPHNFTMDLFTKVCNMYWLVIEF